MATLPAPDRAQGLFETLLVLAGEPVELDAHLDRLAASLAALFEAELPPRIATDAGEHARGTDLGRMRITVDPKRTAATLESEDVDPADFFPSRERGAALRLLPCDGGLGRHKWADRRRLDEVAGGPVPLLVDRGDVLEAGRANLFVAIGNALFTPPDDGRILPGIARRGAIAAARDAGIEVTEKPLSRDELLAAEEVFLTGSVRGVEPACTLDGTRLAGAGSLSRQVGEGLRRRWLDGPSVAAAPVPAAAPPPGPLVR
jgi:para-aminobenzoate synthetase/4-amino-4-deoxychorismate lyase